MIVEFEKIKAIPIIAVLSRYKVETRKRSNTEYVANCPFPSHKESAHQQWTLAISTEKRKFYCHSETCRAASNKPKGGDVIDLVQLLENFATPLEAGKKLAELFAVDETHNPPSKPLEGNKPLAFELKGINPEHPMIQSRGISVETATHFGIGLFSGKGSMSNRIVFPLFENDALIGYAGRALLETKENPKWKLPQGFVRSFVYALERCDPAKPLILVESCWAPLYFHQRGHQAAALMGKSLTDAQESCLSPFQTLIVAMDNDDTGKEASQKLVDRLQPNHKVMRAHLQE